MQQTKHRRTKTELWNQWVETTAEPTKRNRKQIQETFWGTNKKTKFFIPGNNNHSLYTVRMQRLKHHYTVPPLYWTYFANRPRRIMQFEIPTMNNFRNRLDCCRFNSTRLNNGWMELSKDVYQIGVAIQLHSFGHPHYLSHWLKNFSSTQTRGSEYMYNYYLNYSSFLHPIHNFSFSLAEIVDKTLTLSQTLWNSSAVNNFRWSFIEMPYCLLNVVCFLQFLFFLLSPMSHL